MVVGVKRSLYDAEVEIQKRSRMQYFPPAEQQVSNSPYPGSGGGGCDQHPSRSRSPIQSSSFLNNLRSLQEGFPDVNTGLLKSMLETTENDHDAACSLVAQICNTPTPLGDESASAAVGCADAHNVRRKRHLSSPISGDSPNAVSSSDFVEEWTSNAIRGLQGAASIQEAHARLKPRVEVLVDEVEMRSKQKEEQERQYRQAKRRGPATSILVDPVEYEALQRKIVQSSSTQQILARAVKAQHEKMMSWERSMVDKNQEVSCLKDELKEVGTQLRRAREANATLQYYMASVSSQQTTDFIHRRGPDIF
eukprot:Platyproteum_vivax@DN9003_c0_g1_i1.p1